MKKIIENILHVKLHLPLFTLIHKKVLLFGSATEMEKDARCFCWVYKRWIKITCDMDICSALILNAWKL